MLGLKDSALHQTYSNIGTIKVRSFGKEMTLGINIGGKKGASSNLKHVILVTRLDHMWT